MVAQWLEIDLADIEVSVDAEVDVRGALQIDRSVPVGFQRIRCEISGRVTSGTQDPARLKALAAAAEACCVVMQTLKQDIDVRSTWQLDNA